MLEDAVRLADAGGHFRLAFTGRRTLASLHSGVGRWDRAFPLFSRCLSEYDQWPGEFGPEEDQEVRAWYPDIAESMAEFPEITLAQLYGAFEDMERRIRAAGHGLRDVYRARRWVAQLARDWPTEERYFQLWMGTGGPDPQSIWDFEALVERLVRRGDDASLDQAVTVALPALQGRLTFSAPVAPIQSLMLLPLARRGHLAEAKRAWRESSTTMDEAAYRLDYWGMHLEYCAHLGEFRAGLEVISDRLRLFRRLGRPNGKLEFAVGGSLFTRRLLEEGRGAERVRAGNVDTPVTIAELHGELRGVALDLAARFDRRNGTTSQGDWIRARLGAPPLAPTPAPARSRGLLSFLRR